MSHHLQSPEELADRLTTAAEAIGRARLVVAIAGAPGAGKSTLAARLATMLDPGATGRAAVLPMDGFHYDDTVLEAHGERARKGAPHTFDLDGLTTTIDRLRADDGRNVAVPVFDRDLEIARAGARIVPAHARIVLVEGTYLLLDEPGWAALRRRFAVTVMLTVPAAVLDARLSERWRGLSATAFAAKMDGNDRPNIRRVLTGSAAADHTLANG